MEQRSSQHQQYRSGAAGVVYQRKNICIAPWALFQVVKELCIGLTDTTFLQRCLLLEAAQFRTKMNSVDDAKTDWSTCGSSAFKSHSVSTCGSSALKSHSVDPQCGAESVKCAAVVTTIWYNDLAVAVQHTLQEMNLETGALKVRALISPRAHHGGWTLAGGLSGRYLAMGPVRIRHSSHDFGWQSSHSVDLAGWQAKMASIESGIP